jgi:SAM-dependent methyltransferase
MIPHASVIRLNWGCGSVIAPGWLNCDVLQLSGVDLCRDVRDGLPLESDSIDCIAGIHVLQDLPYLDIDMALCEIYRVLKSGGVLRLGVPDLDKAIHAYLAGDAAYFYVPDKDAECIGAKLVTQLIWYGSVRTPVTYSFLEERLASAKYRNIRRCQFGVTESRFPELASLDNRERESLFVEASK